jgi:hypothetical protein
VAKQTIPLCEKGIPVMCVLAAAPVLGLSAGTAAAISVGTSVLGFAMQAIGQKQAGDAQAGQYQYQAAVDRNNKIISDRQAADALKRGEADEQAHRRKVQSIKADQRVSFAARGVDLGSDNVIDTLSDTAMLGELDALTIRSNAGREAYGYNVQGMNYEASAQNNSLAAKGAKKAGKTGALTTILSGASTVGGMYSDYKSKGIL